MPQFFSIFSILFLSYSAVATDIVNAMNSYKADKSAINRLIENHQSDEYYERIDLLYTYWISYMERVTYESLSQDGKIDYHIFNNHLLKNQYFHKQSYLEYKDVKHVVAFANEIYAFNIARRRAIRPNAKDIGQIMDSAAIIVKNLIDNLKNSKKFDSWQKALLASDIVKSLRVNTESTYKFYYDYDPEFTWWVMTPYDRLMMALISYEETLKNHFDVSLHEDDGSGIVGRPIRRAMLEKELAYEYIPYTAEELIAEANRQYAWCEQEMIKASTNLGYGQDWKKALEYVKNKHMAPGLWPEEVGEMAIEAMNYLETHDLITIPFTAKETWRMNMLSAESQKLNAFFLGGESIYIAYPTSEMSHAEKMMSLRGNNPHFGRAVVHHELIPGHHLQWYMNDRYHTHRNGFGTSFWVEGWPIYWEFTLYEMGFPRNDEDKIGMLFWRMHRAARIIYSLQYHLGLMSPQQCIDFLVDKVGHERFNAEAEVRRSFTGRYGPLYQIAYMIGGLQVMALKSECMDSGNMTLKQFNDTFIRQNNMPIELLRFKLLNLDLPKEYKTRWKFLD